MTGNSYLLGLDICRNISIVAGAVFYFILVFAVYSGETDKNLFNLLGIVLFCVFPGIGISIVSFLLTYPVLNLFLQKFLTLGFYTKEISQGTLGLRITSLLIGWTCLKSFYNFFADKVLDTHKELTAEYPDLQGIESFLSDTSINMVILPQNIIYGSITLLLWVFIFLSKSLLELKIVSWGLFFIVDDWAIISDNLIALKGRVLKWHRLRILFFNGLLFIFIVSACFRKLEHTFISSLITLLLGILIITNLVAFFDKDAKAK